MNALAATTIALGRDQLGRYDVAVEREWLVTNGLGGYASGTVAGPTTRRYHGLLVASLRRPGRAGVMVTALDACGPLSRPPSCRSAQ